MAPLFYSDRKTLLALPVSTIVGNFRVPVTCHINLHVSAVLAWRFRPRNGGSWVHLHPRHVHLETEFHVANIHESAVAIAKFEHDLVVAFAEAACEICQTHCQVVDGLGNKRRTA